MTHNKTLRAHVERQRDMYLRMANKFRTAGSWGLAEVFERFAKELA